jgi:hypothetical protein
MSYLKLLNKEQKDIVIDTSFLNEPMSLCIIACAGSGKTRTLISKIIYMITELNCDPSDFFITTFTRNAANELKERLSEYIDIEDINKMALGTFHSIAYSHVMQNKDCIVEDNIESYLYKYSEIISDKKEIEYIDIIANDVSNNECNDIVCNDIVCNDIVDDVSDDESIDSTFGNMVFEETNSIDEEITEFKKYKYVFIDEYQDINEIQETIIRSLYKHAKLLVVVGDDQQNIYTFRNTNIKYILNFTENYNNSTYKYLVKNYRCNVNFVKLANIILSYNENKIDKTIIAMKEEKPKKIKMIHFKNQKNQIRRIVEIIEEYVKNDNVQLHNIAIIARQNSVLKYLEYVFASSKIPSYYIETNQDNIIARENIQNIKDKIIISTVHGTKGLEFDDVYIIDVNDEVFPSKHCKDIEEERRLLYVGITRAKNKLHICFNDNNRSCFINEILSHPDHAEIIMLKGESEELLVQTKKEPKIVSTKIDYSVSNIIANMNYLDFEEFGSVIYDYYDEEPEITNLHSKIPEYFGEFCRERNLIISNISSIFGDFIETFISRSVLQSKGKELENFDYLIYALYHFENGIDDIRSRKSEKIVDGKFSTNLENKTNEELERLILYYQSGIRINGFIYTEFLPYFINSYKRFTSNRLSKDIIFDIFIISLVKGIIRGRSSLLHLINFDKTKYVANKINQPDLMIYKTWLQEIEESCEKYFTDYDNIDAYYTICDEQSSVKGMFDLYVKDTIIEIKSYNSENPRIEMLMQILSYAALARRQGKEINYCSLYNPIHGNIYTWDLTEWDGENDLLFFLNERFY